MTVSTVLQLASVLFSGAAAISWWISARVLIPKKYVVRGVHLRGPHEPGEPQKIDSTVLAVEKQSKWSAAAAFCAGLASASQALTILFG
jgi:hypothetical protein